MEILGVKIAFVQINWNSIIECKKLEGFLFNLMTFQEIYMKFYEVNKLKIRQQHLDKKIHEKIEPDTNNFHVEIFVLLSFMKVSWERIFCVFHTLWWAWNFKQNCFCFSLATRNYWFIDHKISNNFFFMFTPHFIYNILLWVSIY